MTVSMLRERVWWHLQYFPMCSVILRVTITCSRIIVCHRVPCITLHKSYQIFTTTSRSRRHSAIVRHSSNLVTVHSQVTVGGSSVEFEYNFLRQFARTVGCRVSYTSVLSICTTLLQGHMKGFWKRNFPVYHSLYSKLLATVFRV